MWPQVFQSQPDELFTWPLIALFLAMAVFFTQLVRILRAPKDAVSRHARMPLDDQRPVEPRQAEKGPAPAKPPADESRKEEVHRER